MVIVKKERIMKAIARNILLHHLRTDYVSRAGRPRTLAVDYVLERVAYVLRTGCQWTNLPVENGSWKTIYHYFSQWSKKHVFERAFLDILRFYLRRRGGVSKNIVVDTSFVKNVWGRDCLGKSPVDRGRKATKVSALTDNIGTPLYLLFHPGNKYDGKTLAHMLQKVDKLFEIEGRSLFGDKGYDSSRCRDAIRRYGLVDSVTKKRAPTCPERNRTRIVAEHAFSWFDKYRRIILRYDGLVCHFRSFHFLAALQIVASRCALF